MRWVMEERENKDESKPVIMIVERRTNRQSELSSSDVMRILRKRAIKGGWKNTTGGSKSAG
jgi:hypothetical protein